MKFKLLAVLVFALVNICGLALAQAQTQLPHQSLAAPLGLPDCQTGSYAPAWDAGAPCLMAHAANDRPVDASPWLQSGLRVNHTWTMTEGLEIVGVRADFSLATVIGPHTLLTHNHFDAATGHLPQEFILLQDHFGKVIQQAASELTREAINPGTQLWRVRYDLAVPSVRLADAATLAGLAPGDKLTVVFWDEAGQQTADGEFTIVAIRNGIVKLSDPEQMINPGDSGGGAYFRGRLVGNIWSINLDQSNHRLATFNVALLPPDLTSWVR